MSDLQRIIAWEDPPPRRRSAGRRDWSTVARELRSRPGEWARIFEAGEGDVESERAKSITQGVRTANLTAFAPRGAFESAYRSESDRSAVYARFVGEGEPL